MNKIKSEYFNIYSAFVNCLEQNKAFSSACKTRENAFIVAKLKEYFIATIVKGDVAFEVGCDIINSKLLPNKKIEVKSSGNSIQPKRKTDYLFRANNVLITSKFKEDNSIDLKSDLFVFNFEGDKTSIIAKSKDVGRYITSAGCKLIFNTKYLENIKIKQIKWEESDAMSINCVLNLLKYCASPMPKVEYGDFEDYLDFCLTHDINHFQLAKKYVL